MRLAFALALLAACGPRTSRPSATGDVPWASSGIDWSTPPAVRDVPWSPPSIGEATLGGGIRLVVVENHRLPLVAVSVLHHAAGSRADGAQLGVAALTVDLLDEGAAELAGLAFARTLDRHGTSLDSSIATDYAVQRLVTRTRDLATAIDLLASTIRRPRFDDADVVRVRDARVAELGAQRSETRRIAAQVFDRVVFGAHPYAHPADGTRATMAAMTVADVRAFWQRAYRPDAMTVIAVGDVTLAGLRAQLDRAFADWQAPASAIGELPALPAYAPQLVYVDVPGATETNVIVGRRAPGTTETNRLPADVANALVGGGVDGRLDRELHAKLALTFGASASFWRGDAGGSWGAAATFSTANTGAGLRALLAVLDSARTTDASADELARARTNTLASAQLSFETTASSARAVERLVAHRLPLDSYATLPTRLAVVTAAAMRDALPLADLSIVVVGDWSAIKDGISVPGLTPTPLSP